jgi:hypothetical protein
MKSFVMLLSTLIISHVLLAQDIRIDTLKGGRAALLSYGTKGNIGLEILPTDSTPGKRLMVPEMDIPLIEAFHLSEPIGAKKIVHLNINDVKRLFFDNPEIEVIGNCSAEEVLNAKTFFPDSVVFEKLLLDVEWHVTTERIFCYLTYYIYDDPLYWGGAGINLFCEFSTEGDLLRKFTLNGLGSGSIHFSTSGAFAKVSNEPDEVEMISWSPCMKAGHFQIWDIRNNRMLFDYDDHSFERAFLPKGGTVDIFLAGEQLVEEYYAGKTRTDTTLINMRLIDFRNNNQTYTFRVTPKQYGSLRFHADHIEVRDAAGIYRKHYFTSPFFNSKH